MKEFEVTFEHTETETFTVEAETEAEAKELALYDLGMDDNHCLSQEFREHATIASIVQTDEYDMEDESPE